MLVEPYLNRSWFPIKFLWMAKWCISTGLSFLLNFSYALYVFQSLWCMISKNWYSLFVMSIASDPWINLTRWNPSKVCKRMQAAVGTQCWWDQRFLGGVHWWSKCTKRFFAQITFFDGWVEQKSFLANTCFCGKPRLSWIDWILWKTTKELMNEGTPR